MKKLFLSQDDKKLAGVCGGLAEYFEIDPTVVRLATALLALATGVVPCLVAYFVAWLMIPGRPKP
jgi:phage shock protein PspC (stress-responsive transcriptional regulator)